MLSSGHNGIQHLISLPGDSNITKFDFTHFSNGDFGQSDLPLSKTASELGAHNFYGAFSRLWKRDN